MAAKPATATRIDPAAAPKPHYSRLESMLLDRGLVTLEALASVQGRRIGAMRPLVEVLLEQRLVTEDAFLKAIAAEARMTPLSPKDVKPEADVQRLVPTSLAQRHGILPLRLEPDGALLVATADPFQIDVLDEVRARAGTRIRVVLAPPTAVRDGLRAARLGEETFDEILKHGQSALEVEIGAAMPEEIGDEPTAALGVDVESAESPVVRFVNLLLADAIRQGASDVHVEPERDRVRIRFRVDGELHEVRSLPPAVRAPLTSRVKIVAGLDIMETRRPQDGRATVRVESRTYDLRVSTLPSFFGEKIVVRVLDAQAPTFELDGSGIAAPEREAWRSLLRRPNGMLLLTGPTGSGKSSTLYASLLEIRDPSTNLVAIEDPVEFQFPGIVHVPVRPKIGVTFAAALRSVLRQDPDVVLLGEIRDRETAEVAVQAAMTGHLMLSTLHTNDAVGAITRLLDLGVDRELVGSCLLGVMGQRLVRRVCEGCGEPHEWPADVMAALGGSAAAPAGTGRRGKGCATCRGTGLRGRTAIAELVRMTPGLRALVSRGATDVDLRRQAAADGTRFLATAGLEAVVTGRTVPQEVLAVAGPSHVVPLEAPDAPAPHAGPAPAPARNGHAPKGRACAACGKAVEDSWVACPHCGRARAAGTRRETVAVVCDDVDLERKKVAAFLRGRFGRVVEATGGRDALDVIAREKPDVLLLDYEMPDLSGVEVIRRLRSQVETATLPIVMLTASGESDLEAAALDAGADDYLLKPVAAERLVARVGALLASQRRLATAAPQAS
jgi:type IV pilus assembly protein PilB